jgi:hypothetical protein
MHKLNVKLLLLGILANQETHFSISPTTFSIKTSRDYLSHFLFSLNIIFHLYIFFPRPCKITTSNQNFPSKIKETYIMILIKSHPKQINHQPKARPLVNKHPSGSTAVTKCTKRASKRRATSMKIIEVTKGMATIRANRDQSAAADRCNDLWLGLVMLSTPMATAGLGSARP